MKMELQGIIRNIFINQHPLPSSNTIPNKGNKVAMMNPANNLDLSLKLPLPLATTGFEALNSYFFSIRQHSFVNVTEPALSQNVSRSEPTCCGS